MEKLIDLQHTLFRIWEEKQERKKNIFFEILFFSE